MSDGETEPRYVSPSSLAVYATCPRQYEYDKVWAVETPEASRRYLDRGLVYHGVIEDVCEAVADDPTMTDEDIRALALERVDTRWRDETDRREYASDAQYAYDRDLTAAAIDAFFEHDGIEHARNSVAIEKWLQCERDGVHLRGRADNIIRTDDGLRVVDYKGSFNDIVSSYTADRIAAHRDGEEYAAGILKSVFQAATYIEGAKGLDVYEPGMDVEFTFYGLLNNKSRERSLDGIQVSVRGYGRDVGAIYREHEAVIWALIRDCYEGILAENYEPDRFEAIREHACDECDYRAMCADYLGAEVRVDE